MHHNQAGNQATTVLDDYSNLREPVSLVLVLSTAVLVLSTAVLVLDRTKCNVANRDTAHVESLLVESMFGLRDRYELEYEYRFTEYEYDL